MSLSDPNLNSVPQTTDPKAATASKAAKPKVNWKVQNCYKLQGHPSELIKSIKL